MGKYKIAGITIEFNYCFPDYFQGRIEKYQIDDEVKCDYYLNVSLADEINPPTSNGVRRINNKDIYEENGLLVFYHKNLKIEYNESHTYINMILNKNLGERLSEVEYIYTGIYFCTIMLKLGKIPLHGAAIKYQDEAIIFSAPSGTGKSTHANLWKAVFNDIIYINDDKPIISYENDTFYVEGSPWSGKTTLNENMKVPLKAIVFLNQGKENIIRDLKDYEKFIELMRNMYRPETEDNYAHIFTILDLLISKIDISAYDCNISHDAVWTIYHKIYRGEENEN